MVTTTAPPPFLARFSAGVEDPRRLPTSSLLQRLLRGDPTGESRPHPSAYCLVGGLGGCSARPAALKRVRRRRGKLRSTPSGLSQSRFQHFQQHRAGFGRRNPSQEPCNPYEVPVAEEPRLEEAPAASRARTAPAALNKPLRKELFKNKMGKSEVTIPYNQPVHSVHLCDQSKMNRQRSKCNISLNKISTTKKNGSNFWQESLSPDLIKNHEKKPLKNTENIKSVKSKKPPMFLTEANQKENYAGAKFSDPPSPSVLPKPPSHWVGNKVEYSDQNKEMMAVHLKTLLKVQA